MLPRRQRIPQRAFPKGPPRRSRKSAAFVVKEFEPGGPTARFAIVVGKKTDRRAARRHLLKRRAAALIKKTPLAPADFIVLILPPANALAPADFRAGLEALLLNKFPN